MKLEKSIFQYLRDILDEFSRKIALNEELFEKSLNQPDKEDP